MRPPVGLRASRAGCVAGCAAAFTLIEMLVALAITAVALAVVAQIFGITTQTARTSAAISEVEAAVRSFGIQLESDLAGIDKTRSVLVLVGRTQPAARTAERLAAGLYYRELVGDPRAVPPDYNPELDPVLDAAEREAYSDPRADLMMFFTHAPSPSRAPASAVLSNRNDQAEQLQRALQRGSKVAPVQVVYGHAAQTSVAIDSGGRLSYGALRHIADTQNSPLGGQISQIPASRWVLARRATLLVKGLNGASTNYDEGKQAFGGTGSGDPALPGAGRVGEFARILRGYSRGANPNPADDRWAADAVGFDYDAFLSLFNVAANVVPPLDSADWPAGRRPYLVTRSGPLAWTNARAVAAREAIYDVLYATQDSDPSGKRHVATVIDNPPAELQTNLSLQALPGCAWFQVEFLLPEDPRNSLDHPLSTGRTDMARWCQVEPGEMYVFVPDNEQNRALVASDVNAQGQPEPGSRAADFAPRYPGDLSVANRIIRMWPYAIRVTVRVFDSEGRLETPVVRRFVHRFD